MSVKLDQNLVVIILWGGKAVEDYYDFGRRNSAIGNLLLSHTKVYRFNTPSEAEAFRLGIQECNVPSAREMTEITIGGYKNLLTLQSYYKSRNIESSAINCKAEDVYVNF